MKVYLYNAISIDGYIATADDGTDWVSDTDWEIFSGAVKEKKAIIMGRRTYETSGDDFPYDCDLNVVMTRNKDLIESAKSPDKEWFTDKSPAEIIAEIEKRGFEECLIIGGGTINAAFLKEKLVNEITISVHPIILGQGIKLFEKEAFAISLKRISTKELAEDLVQIKYQVTY